MSRLGIWGLAALVAACGGAGPKRQADGGEEADDDRDDGPYVPREAYGRSPLPFWHPLTPGEVQALQGLEPARTGAALALFDFAIMGSGDRIQDTEPRERVVAFIEQMKPVMAAEPDPWQRAFKLHRAMHEHFFGFEKGQDDLGNYDFDRSDVAGIFRQGKYNCISSSILYIVLARAFDFQVEGVLVPTHAFVQVTLPDGRKIEVETTSPTGFDWIHDDKFYAFDAKKWGSRRGLPPVTKAQYDARQIVPPYLLVASNMSNQHTREDRFTDEDRGRLYELAATLAYDDRETVKNGLSTLHNEAVAMSRAKDYAGLARLAEKVRPAMDAALQRFSADAQLVDMITWQRGFAVEAFAALNRTAEARRVADEVLVGSGGGGEAAKARDYAVSKLAKLQEKLTDAQQFAEAEAGYAALGDHCAQRSWCSHNRAYNLLSWASADFKRQAWAESIEHCGAAEKLASNEEQRTLARHNAAAAWVNWANDHMEEGNWPKAAEVLDKCLASQPDEPLCRKAKDDLVAQHRM